jgi:hypothetical protein
MKEQDYFLFRVLPLATKSGTRHCERSPAPFGAGRSVAISKYKQKVIKRLLRHPATGVNHAAHSAGGGSSV